MPLVVGQRVTLQYLGAVTSDGLTNSRIESDAYFTGRRTSDLTIPMQSSTNPFIFTINFTASSILDNSQLSFAVSGKRVGLGKEREREILNLKCSVLFSFYRGSRRPSYHFCYW